MKNETFDVKLLIYQSLIAIPTQVALLGVYEKLPQKSTNSYITMSLLNLGALSMQNILSKELYNLFHATSSTNESSIPPEARFYSPLTNFNYSFAYETIQTLPPSMQANAKAKLLKLLEKEPVYSENYLDIALLLFTAYSTFGFLNAPQNNLIGKLLYGLTQPTSVVLKDSGKIK